MLKTSLNVTPVVLVVLVALVALAVLLPPGRKRLYTPEEAIQVAKAQRRESYLRRQERIQTAREDA